MGEWVTASAGNGACLQALALSDGQVLLRDDERPGVIVITSGTSWRAFLAGVKAGRFDQVAP